MDVEQLVYRLQLHDHHPTDQEIAAIGIVDHQILVVDRTKFLLLKFDPSQRELMRQRPLGCRLQQTRTQLAMNLNRSTHDLFRQFIHLCDLCDLCDKSSGLPRKWTKNSDDGPSLRPVVGGVVGVGDSQQVGFAVGLTDELQADGQSRGAKAGGN